MSKFAIELKWGVIFTLSGLIWMFFERLVGLHSTHIAQHYIYTNFFAIIAISIFVLALRDKRANFYQGNMSYGQGFVCGIGITLIVTVLAPISQYLTSAIISPQYFANIIRHSVDTNMMTQSEAEAYFNLNNYIMMATMGAAFMGTVTSAIVAFFVRSKVIQEQ